MQLSTRDKYVDSIKGFLIFLVVYGHIILVNSPNGSFNCALKNFIYLFHMPLFVFISGMFAHIKDRKKYINGIIRILETYALFQLLHYIIPLPYNHAKISLLNYIVFPTWTMWYLLSLASWKMVVYCIGEYALLTHKKLTLLMSFFISLVSGFIPVSVHFSLQRTMCWIPFFMLGYYCNPSIISSAIKKISFFQSILVILIALLGLYFFVGSSLRYITAGSFNYYINANPLISLGERIISFICAIILSISVIRIIPSNNHLANIGKNTLFIYMGHSFVATFVFFVTRYLQFANSTIFLIIWSILTTELLYILAKTKLKMILNPISQFTHSLR